ncbi:MAG: diaminopimelate dehydrogenase, partial [Lactobacillales bacterium]|nr:diaminopimelate dehydrogenase [Lactobacillales bacterium]
MRKISVAIIGWGNVGRGCKRAIAETSDLVLAGVVRRPITVGQMETELADTKVVSDIAKLDKVDVALLCVPSRKVPEYIKHYHSMGICTVDSYDEHNLIVPVKREADISAKTKNVVSIVGAGWDPGTDSAVRVLMRMVSITGHTTTTFGGTKGGRSMGHTAAVKAMPGIKNAVALTLAGGRGKHKRKVYVELQDGVSFKDVEKIIKMDAYFKDDPTEVIEVKDINVYNTLEHSA